MLRQSLIQIHLVVRNETCTYKDTNTTLPVHFTQLVQLTQYICIRELAQAISPRINYSTKQNKFVHAFKLGWSRVTAKIIYIRILIAS
jgi:hypothetical protein